MQTYWTKDGPIHIDNFVVDMDYDPRAVSTTPLPSVLFGDFPVPVTRLRSQFYFHAPTGYTLYRFTPRNLSLAKMEPDDCELKPPPGSPPLSS